VKNFLDRALEERSLEEHPDPLWIVRRYRDPKVAIISALFSYGNARQIVKFLEGLDFSLLEREEGEIARAIDSSYRFQRRRDVVELFITMRRAEGLEERFLSGYRVKGDPIEGIHSLIEYLYSLNPYRSPGYTFLLGRVGSSSPYKRWNMALRWLVRREEPDLGLWRKVNPSHLIVPLDTHLFTVARKLGLLKRRSCNLKTARELTEFLRELDPQDPLKYDFVLYRLGQLNLV